MALASVREKSFIKALLLVPLTFRERKKQKDDAEDEAERRARKKKKRKVRVNVDLPSHATLLDSMLLY